LSFSSPVHVQTHGDLLVSELLEHRHYLEVHKIFAASMARFHLPRVFWIGVAALVLSSGPLLVIIAAAEMGLTSDPNPNPIGPGMLAMLTFWPAIGLMATDLVMAFRRGRPSGTQK
jgi:hypothetical protein